MSEWIRIRVKDFYKDAVGELEYTYVTRDCLLYTSGNKEKWNVEPYITDDGTKAE